ncbi:uncharacterized protein LOC114761620 isoform X2 [Neltuma alba]|uniref:uncharacterized protein LOC114748556 isoform X2 n=1 Tax=Neltuma alba TaxID=207710 RepID=UPI0010A577CC|nr:uncharacterized protein LOC114748556 isoform X2 [Prosopis alba]XP_028806871.1 uncharacterized protein LOC114761620 isoform X2 [Prosopis alba]
MDISAPQYNSASESGWTHYLDQSAASGNYFHMSGGVVEDEEDLSMVSDASSGPPIYHDDDECCYENWYPNHSSSQHTKNSKEKKKKTVKESSMHQQASHLDDDTASSPVFSCSKKKANFPRNGVVEDALEFSQGFSATRMKVKPKIQKHFSFFERSLAGKQASGEPGGFSEGKRK